MRHGLTSELPSELHACCSCKNGGQYAFTRIRTTRPGSTMAVLAHWCDKGRSLTGEEIFRKGRRDSDADIMFEGTKAEIKEIWNAVNAPAEAEDRLTAA